MKETATLSKRETQIAEMIAWGAAKKEVADKLFISTRTVENTARSIFEKTGCTKSNELSAWWFCTNFKISFDLSPLKRKFIAIILLLILLPNEITLNATAVRFFRAKKTETNINARRKETFNTTIHD